MKTKSDNACAGLPLVRGGCGRTAPDVAAAALTVGLTVALYVLFAAAALIWAERGSTPGPAAWPAARALIVETSAIGAASLSRFCGVTV